MMNNTLIIGLVVFMTLLAGTFVGVKARDCLPNSLSRGLLSTAKISLSLPSPHLCVSRIVLAAGMIAVQGRIQREARSSTSSPTS